MYKNFNQRFAGKTVKGIWRDEALAKPIFAKVELARRELYDAGSNGPWEVVPRAKIDHLREMFDIPQKVSELKYDVKLLRVQYFS